MVKKLYKDFSTVELTLYLGMALEGISYEDHQNYINLMDRFPKLNIFYKIKYPLTHIKLYSFSNEENIRRNFVGSANFSEAGLINNEEILLETDEDFQSLFTNTYFSSMLCTDQNVEKFISFFNKENELLNFEDINELTKDKEDEGIRPTQKTYKRKNISPRFKLTRKYRSPSEAEFKIPILLQNNPLAFNRGINAWQRHQDPYLEQSNKYAFSRYFPSDTEFNILTDQNELFKARINSLNDNEMIIYPNIYEYLRRRMNINDHRLIKYDDLIEYGATEIWGGKIEEGLYFFDFSPKIENEKS